MNYKETQKRLDAAGKILGLAKGPLGIITLVAAGVVILQSTAVKINITNNGCDSIPALSQYPVSLPGFHLPAASIPSGSSATAVLPPVTVHVNGTSGRHMTVLFLSQEHAFALPSSVMDISYNGHTLLGTSTEIKLTKDTKQELVVRCK